MPSTKSIPKPDCCFKQRGCLQPKITQRSTPKIPMLRIKRLSSNRFWRLMPHGSCSSIDAFRPDDRDCKRVDCCYPALRFPAGMQASMLFRETELAKSMDGDVDLVTTSQHSHIFTTEATKSQPKASCRHLRRSCMPEWAPRVSVCGHLMARGGVQSQWYGGTARPSGGRLRFRRVGIVRRLTGLR